LQTDTWTELETAIIVTGVLSLLATQKAKSKRPKMLDGFFNWPKNVVLQSKLVKVTVNNYLNGNEPHMFVASLQAWSHTTLYAFSSPVLQEVIKPCTKLLPPQSVRKYIKPHIFSMLVESSTVYNISPCYLFWSLFRDTYLSVRTGGTLKGHSGD